MKRFFSLIALSLGLLMIFNVDADAQLFGGRKDVVISYEHLSADASFKQFKKANKSNQIEILNALVRRANEEYLNCKTIDDLYAVKEQLELIKFYSNEAKQKSISVTNDIRRLDNSISQAEAEFKGETLIEGTRTHYRNKGQEMN